MLAHKMTIAMIAFNPVPTNYCPLAAHQAHYQELWGASAQKESLPSSLQDIFMRLSLPCIVSAALTRRLYPRNLDSRSEIRPIFQNCYLRVAVIDYSPLGMLVAS